MKYFNQLFFISCFNLLIGCKMQSNLPLNAVTDIQLKTNFEKEIELANSFRIDAIVTKNSNIKWKTSGLGGTYSWNNLNVEVENGYFRKGYIYLNQNEKGKNVKVKISSKERPEILDSISIQIPSITQVKFQSPTSISSTSNPAFNVIFTFSSNKTFSTQHHPELYDLIYVEPKAAIVFSKLNYGWVQDFNKVFYSHAKANVFLKSNLHVSDSIACPIDYSNSLVFNVNGAIGKNGINGQDGKDGDLEEPNGYHAGSGENGYNGFHGENVLVKVKSFQFDNDLYFKIDLFSRDIHNQSFMNVSKGAKLSIFSNGGNGGNGGDGGRGGVGIDGNSGISPGYGGNGGNGGDAGYGGNGGIITIELDSLANTKKSVFCIENKGGLAGRPGSYGKSGRGGRKQNPRLFEVLYTGRSGLSGNIGVGGMNGKNGIIEWVLIP